jgi:hypothetical protein
MNTYFYFSAAFAFSAAIGHSWIGEAMLLRPLFAQTEHVGVMKSLTWRRVTRAVWHLPSISWILMAAMTVLLINQQPIARIPLYFASAVYLLSGVGNFIATRGRHFGWVVLGLAGLLLWIGVYQAT